MHNDRKNYRVYTLERPKIKSNFRYNLMVTLVYIILTLAGLISILLQMI